MGLWGRIGGVFQRVSAGRNQLMIISVYPTGHSTAVTLIRQMFLPHVHKGLTKIKKFSCSDATGLMASSLVLRWLLPHLSTSWKDADFKMLGNPIPGSLDCLSASQAFLPKYLQDMQKKKTATALILTIKEDEACLYPVWYSPSTPGISECENLGEVIKRN